jgi:hypothetical protein
MCCHLYYSIKTTAAGGTSVLYLNALQDVFFFEDRYRMMPCAGAFLDSLLDLASTFQRKQKHHPK